MERLAVQKSEQAPAYPGYWKLEPWRILRKMGENGDRTGPERARDIRSDPLTKLTWDGSNPATPLEAVFKYVESEAGKALDWYWRKKGPKAQLSRAIQFSAVVLTALGAIIPVVINILKIFAKLGDVDTGLWASLCVGAAAALIGGERKACGHRNSDLR